MRSIAAALLPDTTRLAIWCFGLGLLEVRLKNQGGCTDMNEIWICHKCGTQVDGAICYRCHEPRGFDGVTQPHPRLGWLRSSPSHWHPAFFQAVATGFWLTVVICIWFVPVSLWARLAILAVVAAYAFSNWVLAALMWLWQTLRRR